jgi:hypothetical protein
MPVGPGKYDAECTQVREATGASLVAVIVIGGKQGQGFSVQADVTNGFMALARLPEILRQMATDIERSNGEA